ncbi:MAG: hypothetical protein AAGN66_05240 [Acidobacteriota bacterium]
MSRTPLVCLAVAALLAALPAAGQNAESFVNFDQEMAAIAEEVPGFAGYYFAEDGVPVVQMTDLSRRVDILDIAGPAETVRFQQAQFAFDTLYAYRQQLTDVLSEPGAVYLDIDEVRNRVVVGVSSKDAARSALLGDAKTSRAAVATRFGVPAEAIEVVETEPILDMLTLRQRVNPAPGGVEVGFGNFVCTLGFVIKQGGTNGFVTNSHCTNTQGGVENTAYRQPFGQARIATEIKDPNYSTGGGCPAGRLCRQSDSSMARFQNNNAALGQFAKVAKPNGRNNGSITIGNGGNARFTLNGKAGSAVGNTVRKVGRTTGWTQGRVTNTCVLTNNENNKTFFCQTFVSAGVGGGDSGSGVLKGRKATGLLWGGNAAGTLFVFSPISNVQAELGNFQVN